MGEGILFSKYMTFRKWHGALVCPWKSSLREIDGKRSREEQEPLELKEQLHCSRRGIVNFAINRVRSFSACAAQTSHSGLSLLKKLTYTEQHLGSARAQADSNNNLLHREQSEQGQPSVCTRAACLRLEARFLIAFLQGNSCCKIFHSCRDYLCRRCCRSWEEEGKQMF